MPRTFVKESQGTMTGAASARIYLISLRNAAGSTSPFNKIQTLLLLHWYGTFPTSSQKSLTELEVVDRKTNICSTSNGHLLV